MTGDGPVVVRKNPDRKVRGLNQHDYSWTHAEFPLAQISRIGRGRQHKVGPTPQIILLFFGERKNVGFMSPKPKTRSWFSGGVPRHGKWLVDDRHNPAGDEIPVFGEADRNHWLNVQYILDTIARPDAEVVVILHRNADEVGNRVLRLFS